MLYSTAENRLDTSDLEMKADLTCDPGVVPMSVFWDQCHDNSECEKYHNMAYQEGGWQNCTIHTRAVGFPDHPYTSAESCSCKVCTEEEDEDVWDWIENTVDDVVNGDNYVIDRKYVPPLACGCRGVDACEATFTLDPFHHQIYQELIPSLAVLALPFN
eukprot:5580759-Amphidinium_carterae.1